MLFPILIRIFTIHKVFTETCLRVRFTALFVSNDDALILKHFVFVFNYFGLLIIKNKLEIPVQILAGILDFLVMIIDFGQGNVELLDVELRVPVRVHALEERVPRELGPQDVVLVLLVGLEVLADLGLGQRAEQGGALACGVM